MSDALLQLLQATHDPSEKAAVIAESILNELPEVTSLAARRCIILHWFDLPIVKALLQDIQLTESQIREAYDQLISLPFIESLIWGSTFQDLTREGLLKHYIVKWPELLKFAASLAAPVYATRKADEAAAGETLFCYIVAGDSQASRNLFNQLLAQAIDQKDWRHGENVLQLQEEAEQLPFVEPLPLFEQDWIMRGLIHTVHGKLETAISDYSKAIEINPNNTIAFISLGIIYAEQQLYEKALSEYALQIDPTIVHAYIDRGVIYTNQERYTEALVDFNHALQLAPRSIFAFRNKCLVLCRLGRYEEAEAVYKQIMRIDLKAAGGYTRPHANAVLQMSQTGRKIHADAKHKHTRHKQNLKRFAPRIIEIVNTLAAILFVGVLLSGFILFFKVNHANFKASPIPTSLSNATPTLHITPIIKPGSTHATTSTPAILGVSPNPLNFGSVTSGQAPTLQETITNSGGQPLNWSLDSTSLPGWLSVDTSSGTVQPGSSQTINVMVNTTNLEAGSYTATLSINSNGGTSAIAIPLIVNPPPTPPLTETFTIPFTDGTPGVSTQNSYSGTVQITVSGTGQAATTQWSDAFYRYTDRSGNLLNPPDHASCWVMYINNQPTDTFVSTPSYDSSHSYTFRMTAPGGTLSFGVCDSVTTDNTGSFTVTVTQD